MICKVLEENNIEYTSIVLAKIENGFYGKVVILDNTKENIIIKDLYRTSPSLKRKVFIVNNDTPGWCNKKGKIKGKLFKHNVSIQGYNWIINKVESMKFNEDDLKKAKELDNEIHYSEWNYVNNKKDVDSLLEAAWGFHDSYIYSISFTSEPYNEEGFTEKNLQVVFKGCWECSIELIFEDIALIHYPLDSNMSDELFEGNVLFNDGYVYWVDEVIDDVSKIDDSFICFKSRALKWKIILDKE